MPPVPSPAPGPGVRLAAHRLAEGQDLDVAGEPGAEATLVLLSGTCTVQTSVGSTYPDIGGRPTVFDGPATAVYLPSGAAARIRATTAVEVAVASTAAGDADDSGVPAAPYLITPDQVRVEQRGRSTWQREVHDILGPDRPAQRLMVGETVSSPGVWSSYPPHRHDRHDPPHERALGEAFLVRLDPPPGLAVMLLYPDADGPEQARVLHDRDIVHLDGGFHAFAAGGGYRLYYLWALSGQPREQCYRTDPRHAWLEAR